MASLVTGDSVTGNSKKRQILNSPKRKPRQTPKREPRQTPKRKPRQKKKQKTDETKKRVLSISIQEIEDAIMGLPRFPLKLRESENVEDPIFHHKFGIYLLNKHYFNDKGESIMPEIGCTWASSENPEYKPANNKYSFLCIWDFGDTEITYNNQRTKLKYCSEKTGKEVVEKIESVIRKRLPLNKYAEKETNDNIEQVDRMTFMELKENITKIISTMNYPKLTLKYIEVVSIKHEFISNKSSGASSSSSNLKSLRNDFLKIKF